MNPKVYFQIKIDDLKRGPITFLNLLLEDGIPEKECRYSLDGLNTLLVLSESIANFILSSISQGEAN